MLYCIENGEGNAMSKIGIICASDTELEPFLPYLENAKITEKAMLKFYEGTLCKAKVVAVFSGVCKVNAAIATQLLIDVFDVNIIINAGTAGGMDERVQLFDTIVSEQLVYHDVAEDILTEFHPWMDTIYFHADDMLLAIAKECSHTLSYPVLFGKVVSGEQFIEEDKREEINQKFLPLAVDMESASVAHVCYVNKVPFLSIRTVTDTATHSGSDNFEKNCEKASRISAEVTVALIGKLN